MLNLLGRRSSFNVQKVVWLLEELQFPYQHLERGGRFGGLDTPEFRAMNPHGRVPVLRDDSTVVWESHAILRYLAARKGTEPFWSGDPSVRARSDQWMDWAQTVLQRDFLNGVFWGFYRTPVGQRNETAVARSIDACARHFRLLERTIGNNAWLLGAAPTLADIVIATHLYRYFGVEIDRPKLPNIEAYYGRLTERPAFRKGVMVPFEDLFGRLDY